MLERAAKASRPAAGRRALLDAATALRDTSRPVEARLAAAASPDVVTHARRAPAARLRDRERRLPLWVDRERALFGSWYEFFPRSEGAVTDPKTGVVRSGTFRTAMERLPAVAAMGFDVVYLPPIHPIGDHQPQGPQQHPDPGSGRRRLALGDRLRTRAATTRSTPTSARSRTSTHFVARARELGLEVALDYALQASPGPPVGQRAPGVVHDPRRRHDRLRREPAEEVPGHLPDQLRQRPRRHLRRGAARRCAYWMVHGVRIFRVDNPHTKPVSFWELADRRGPRDRPRRALPRRGVHPAGDDADAGARSASTSRYTYFTWRNEKWELEEYLTELSTRPAHFLRPNFFVNTPDILHAYLQYGGPPAFKIRAVLAATLSPTWGVYAGLRAVRARRRAAGQRGVPRLREVPAAAPRLGGAPRPRAAPSRRTSRALNGIRRRHPALQRLRNLHFHRDRQRPDHLPSPRRRRDGADDTVLVVVNLDPHGGPRDDGARWTCRRSGWSGTRRFAVHDELTGETYLWGEHNYVRLDPFSEPAHVFRVRPAVARPDGRARAPSTRSPRSPSRRDRQLRRPARRASATRTGTSAPSSTRCWCARSRTATATASATSRA